MLLALQSLKAEAKLIEKEADATQFTFREGVLERALVAPLDLDTSVTHEAAQMQKPPTRPMIGDLRRAANPEPLKYKELPRAAKPPQHVKYVSEARAVARTNANIADRLPKGTPTREALKVSMRLSGPSEAKELGELSKMLAPSPMGRSRREDHGVLAKKAAAMAEAYVSGAPMPFRFAPTPAYKMPGSAHLASRDTPVEETDPSALAEMPTGRDEVPEGMGLSARVAVDESSLMMDLTQALDAAVLQTVHEEDEDIDEDSASARSERRQKKVKKGAKVDSTPQNSARGAGSKCPPRGGCACDTSYPLAICGHVVWFVCGL